MVVVGFVIWLRTSDRLNRERIDRVREMLAITVEEEKALLEEIGE